MERQVLAYALLFSVPTGVGVALAVMVTTRGTAVGMAAGGALITTVLIFLLVAVAGTYGEPDIERRD